MQNSGELSPFERTEASLEEENKTTVGCGKVLALVDGHESILLFFIQEPYIR